MVLFYLKFRLQKGAFKVFEELTFVLNKRVITFEHYYLKSFRFIYQRKINKPNYNLLVYDSRKDLSTLRTK